jgi:hypothetical protein
VSATKKKRPKVPELMGAAEAAEEIGTAVQNLGSLLGMPEPVAQLRATRVWLADEVRAFAVEYQTRPKVQLHRKGSSNGG